MNFIVPLSGLGSKRGKRRERGRQKERHKKERLSEREQVSRWLVSVLIPLLKQLKRPKTQLSHSLLTSLAHHLSSSSHPSSLPLFLPSSLKAAKNITHLPLSLSPCLTRSLLAFTSLHPDATLSLSVPVVFASSDVFKLWLMIVAVGYRCVLLSVFTKILFLSLFSLFPTPLSLSLFLLSKLFQLLF